MMRLRRASTIAALCVLTSAATASAECALDVRASVVYHPLCNSIGGVDLP
jgi:hypothetical protein